MQSKNKMDKLDRFGAPVSHGVQSDIDTYGEAAELMLGYALDPVGMVKALLETCCLKN